MIKSPCVHWQKTIKLKTSTVDSCKLHHTLHNESVAYLSVPASITTVANNVGEPGVSCMRKQIHMGPTTKTCTLDKNYTAKFCDCNKMNELIPLTTTCGCLFSTQYFLTRWFKKGKQFGMLMHHPVFFIRRGLVDRVLRTGVLLRVREGARLLLVKQMCE